MSNWPSSTRAILASGQPRRPRTRASAWRWSSCQEPAKASFFYRVDGLWNGSSPGLPGSVASPGTMKDCRKPWKDCTSSLSPASCSPEAAVSSHSSLQALRTPHCGRVGISLLEDVAQRLGPPLEIGEDALLVALLVVGSAGIGIVHPMTQGVIEEHRDLAGGGGDGLGLADARGQPA